MDYIKYLREMVGQKPVIMVSAGILIFDQENRILLQKRKDSHTWGLNGGFMEMGETTEQTARREILEETALTVGKLELYKVWTEDIKTLRNGDAVQIVHITYVSKDLSGELKPQEDEVLALQYFDLENLPKALFTPHIELISELTQYPDKLMRLLKKVEPQS